MTADPSQSSPAPQPAFHSDDLDEVAEYRSMSALAIVSFVFGLAAPLCFVAPLLLVIPLVGAALSIIALRRIAASEGTLAGSWAAAAGLALCVASLLASISHAQTARILRSNQAEQFARQWIGLLLSDDTQHAFQLTLDATRPPPPPEPGEPAPEDNRYEMFANHPFVQSVLAAGADSDVRLAGTLSYEPQPAGQCIVEQRFLITPSTVADTLAPSERSPVDAILTLQRSRLSRNAPMRWLVRSYEPANAASNEPHTH